MPFGRLRQGAGERGDRPGGCEYIGAVVAAVDDVVKRPRILNAKLSRHPPVNWLSAREATSLPFNSRYAPLTGNAPTPYAGPRPLLGRQQLRTSKKL